ncbi:hypothetical protein GCM10023148_54880 [Actinokineospora soli]
MLVLAAVVTLWARFGPPDWLLADEHPVRNVVEGLSWPAGILALVWVAVPSAWRWMRPAPQAPDRGPVVSGGQSVRESTILGPNMQAGGDIRDVTLGDAALPPRPTPGSEPW